MTTATTDHLTGQPVAIDSVSGEPFTPITEADLDAWIIELDTTDRAQVKGQLRETFLIDGDPKREAVGYCCLGVKCDMDPAFDLDAVEYLMEPYYNGTTAEMFWFENSGVDAESEHIPEPIAGLSYKTRHALANANDDGSHAFKDIAAALNLHRELILAGGDLQWVYATKSLVPAETEGA